MSCNNDFSHPLETNKAKRNSIPLKHQKIAMRQCNRF